MSGRSVVAWLLGLWLGCSLFMVIVATRNFRMVDQVLGDPVLQSMVKQIEPGKSRQVLRYLASELNRWYFETWEWTQLAIGLFVLLLVYSALPRQRLPLVLALLLLIIVAAERLALTPQIVALGRSIDFVSQGSDVDGGVARATFWRYHHLYSGLEVTKMAMLAALTAIVLRRDRRDQ